MALNSPAALGTAALPERSAVPEGRGGDRGSPLTSTVMELGSCCPVPAGHQLLSSGKNTNGAGTGAVHPLGDAVGPAPTAPGMSVPVAWHQHDGSSRRMWLSPRHAAGCAH